MHGLIRNQDLNGQLLEEITDGLIMVEEGGTIKKLDSRLSSLFNGHLLLDKHHLCFEDVIKSEFSGVFTHHLDLVRKEARASSFYMDVENRYYQVNAYLIDTTVAFVFLDKSAEKDMNAAIDENVKRMQLLYEVASDFIMEEDTSNHLDQLFERVSKVLNLDFYFNYTVVSGKKKIFLQNYKGITEETAEGMKWLDYGEAVCGTVAQTQKSMVVENVQNSANTKVSFIQQLGVTAYACYPLFSYGRIIGTLSFGSSKRKRFTLQELELLEKLAVQVAKVMERARMITGLKDVSREKNILNDQLIQQQERLSNIIEGALDGILIMDDSCRFLELNRSGTELLGIEDLVVTSLYLDEFILKEDLPLKDYYVNEMVETGNVYGEIRLRTRKGKVRTFGFNGVYGINPNQNLVIFRDITSQKLIEKKLLEAKKEAEEANKVKTDFLLSMSHEFRTPLNTIIGFSELLSENAETYSTKDVDRFAKIGHAGRELLTKINGILNHTRVRYDGHTQSDQLFNVATTLNKVHHYLYRKVSEKNLHFTMATHEFDHFYLFGKEEQFYYPMKELLATIVNRVLDGGYLEISGVCNENVLHIKIRYAGEALSKEEQTWIREGEHSLSYEGIKHVDPGLFMAVRMIHELDGELSFTCDSTEGSTIRILLPILRKPD